MASTTTKPKLYVLSWGPFPRRVLIYLKERGMVHDFDIVDVVVGPTGLIDPPGKPPGTVPILALKTDDVIYQSLSILKYLEDKYPGPKSMRGATPEAAARVRDLTSVVDEACVHFLGYIHNASGPFNKPGEKQTREAAIHLLRRFNRQMSLLERLADPTGPYLAGPEVSLADCVTMSLLQFVLHVFEMDLCEKWPKLRMFYDAFSHHASTEWPDTQPRGLAEVAKQLTVTDADL